MMKVDKVAAQPDRAGRFKVTFEDGSVMHLYKQTVQDFSVYSGRELTAVEMGALQDAAETMSAKMRAVRIVAASSVSKKELQHRLIQKGENPEKANEAVQWLEKLAVVDDGKTAETIVQKCIHKGYGITRAKQMLFEKKIPKEYWEQALADYPDQTENIVSYLKVHLDDANDPKKLRKMIDALLRRGHNYNQIRNALESVIADIEDLPEG